MNEYLWRVYTRDGRTIGSGRVSDYDMAHASICSCRGVCDKVVWTSRNIINHIYVGYIPSISGDDMWYQCCIMRADV